MHGHGQLYSPVLHYGTARNLPSSIQDPIQLHVHAQNTDIIHTSCIAGSVVLDSSLPATQESKHQATDISV